jgi:hypothetical protein
VQHPTQHCQVRAHYMLLLGPGLVALLPVLLALLLLLLPRITC